MGLVEELSKMSLEELKAENEKIIKESYPYNPILMAIIERDKYHNEKEIQKKEKELKEAREYNKLSLDTNQEKVKAKNEIIRKLGTSKIDKDLKDEVLKELGRMSISQELFIAEKYGFVKYSQWDNTHLDISPWLCPFCGSCSLVETNQDFITDSIIGEYDVSCSECNKFICHFAYGHYDLDDYFFMNEEIAKSLSNKNK